jgi:chitinase
MSCSAKKELARLGVVLFLGFASLGLAAAAPAVIAYLPNYRMQSFDAGRLSGVTDLIYFNITPTKSGGLPTPTMPASDLAKLRKITRDYDGRVLITVGGWACSDGFPALSASAAARSRFIRQLTAFCVKNKFGGIDYDWEHPTGAQQLADYSSLITETREHVRPRGMWVTVAQAGWQNLGTQIYANVDRVHLMAYDHPFPQATFEKSTADVERLVAWGCPPPKIAFGIPFHGRNEKRVAKTYAELSELQRSKMIESDDIRSGYAFNGPGTVKKKVAFTLSEGLAGIMVWELGQDASGSEALMPIVLDAIRGTNP